jgi:hypothetical protein
MKRETYLAQLVGDAGAVRHMRAWLLLVGALAVHVIDEALTDFLDFYNPLVLSIRSQFPWFPMPTFTFGVWLAGLVLLVTVLVALAPMVRRGGTAMWLLSWVLSLIMLGNGLGHLAGSVYFQRWLPGAASAPLLLAASVFLLHATEQRRRADLARRPGASDPALHRTAAGVQRRGRQ